MLSEQILMRLREAREKANMTQADVANVIGMTRSTIAMWETGRAPITLESLIKLARIYDVRLGWLVAPADAVEITVRLDENQILELRKQWLANQQAQHYGTGWVNVPSRTDDV
jgi:transcriptional regulator with XRE-family HTH domain